MKVTDGDCSRNGFFSESGWASLQANRSDSRKTEVKCGPEVTNPHWKTFSLNSYTANDKEHIVTVLQLFFDSTAVMDDLRELSFLGQSERVYFIMIK